MPPQTVILNDRACLGISGPDAEHFLQNLITTDLDALAPDEWRASALLSPQGKILFDFLVTREGAEGFRLDARADVLDDLTRRLALYRLRAKATIDRLPEQLVEISWNIGSPETSDGARRDTRFPAAWGVTRRFLAGPNPPADPASWHELRIAGGVAESGHDYALGDAFPHDVLLDQNGGVGFRKGCYVGQEVVSRMHHRGTARRRVMIASAQQALPSGGAEITASGRAMGALGTVFGPKGLAIVRIDRLADALAQGAAVLAGAIPVVLAIPPGASFALPAADLPAEGA